MKIIAADIAKYFNEKKIFGDINFTITSGRSLTITGPNGSGKTTLIKIISGLMRPTVGSLMFYSGEEEIQREQRYQYLSLVSPYFELYEELSAYENLHFLIRLRDIKDGEQNAEALLKRVNLYGREHDAVKTYSSGMRQRLKYVFALLSNPEVLLLDEPTSNLDADGIDIVYEIIQEQKGKKIVIIATNDRNDLKYGDQRIEISD
jgi:heme exporter protein A